MSAGRLKPFVLMSKPYPADTILLVLQLLVFGSAAAVLVATGHRTLALVFALAVVINAVLMYVWGQ